MNKDMEIVDDEMEDGKMNEILKIIKVIIKGGFSIVIELIRRNSKKKSSRENYEKTESSKSKKLKEYSKKSCFQNDINKDEEKTKKGFFVNTDDYDIDSEEYWVTLGAFLQQNRNESDVSLKKINGGKYNE